MKTTWNSRPALLDRLIETVARAALLAAGRGVYRVRAVGVADLPRNGGAVFVCNHVSYADTIPLSLAAARRFRFTSYEGLFQAPLLGRALRAFGSIPVSAVNARETVRRAAACAAAGESVLIFPEGKLTLDGRLQPIRGGYELIARRAGVPVVMVHLDGMWGSIFSFSGGRWFFKWPRPWRRDVRVTFSRPLSPAEATPERLAAFWAACANVSPTSPHPATVPA